MNRSKRLSSRAFVRAALMLGTVSAPVSFVATAAHAQDYTNVAASGRVTNDAGAPIAGAEVRITSTERGVSRSATTSETGAYNIPQLPPGNYDFEITAAGYGAYREVAIPLTRNSGAANSFRLVGASAEGEIVVTGTRQRTTDFQDNTTGAVIDLASLDKRVPVSRTLRDVMLLTPGTVQGTSNNPAFRNQVSIDGSSFSENAFYINGLNISDFRTGLQPSEVPYDFYQTVEVKTGGLPAEFGRATGGVVNAVTKSGTNEYHASVLGSWEPNGLRSTSPSTYALNNEDAEQSRKEAVFQASGPIVRDHLFFYGLYNLRGCCQSNANQSLPDAVWSLRAGG